MIATKKRWSEAPCTYMVRRDELQLNRNIYVTLSEKERIKEIEQETIMA